jgi:hypothetical protein
VGPDGFSCPFARIDFRVDGKCFVWFGAAANHCAIYGVLGDQDKVALGSAANTIAATVKFNANNNVILHLILGSSGKLSVLSSLCG